MPRASLQAGIGYRFVVRAVEVELKAVIDDHHSSVFFVTISCHRKLNPFQYDALKDQFVKHLRETCDRFGIGLWAYVVMDNHVHLVVATEKGQLKPFLSTLKRMFSYRSNQYLAQANPALYRQLHVRRGRKAPFRFWMAGGGYIKNLFDMDTARKAMNYAHENPVRAGLVEVPEEWRWSGARWWKTGEAVPIRVDHPDEWGVTDP